MSERRLRLSGALVFVAMFAAMYAGAWLITQGPRWHLSARGDSSGVTLSMREGDSLRYTVLLPGRSLGRTVDGKTMVERAELLPEIRTLHGDQTVPPGIWTIVVCGETVSFWSTLCEVGTRSVVYGETLTVPQNPAGSE